MDFYPTSDPFSIFPKEKNLNPLPKYIRKKENSMTITFRKISNEYFYIIWEDKTFDVSESSYNETTKEYSINFTDNSIEDFLKGYNYMLEIFIKNNDDYYKIGYTNSIENIGNNYTFKVENPIKMNR